MKINNVEFELDFTDADFVERLEKGKDEVNKQIEEIQNNKDLTTAEGIRQECKVIKDFLDYVLGEGSSQKIFGEKNSLSQCIKALEDILKAKEEQEKELNSRLIKYSPDRLKR